MAKYRYLHAKFWTDPHMLELTPEQKFFYAYLLTSPDSSQCGISEIHPKTISHHTGYNTETVLKLITIFEDMKKIKYNPETKELAIKNWGKYNYIANNEKVKICIQKEFAKVKDRNLIDFMVAVDDELIIEPEEESHNDIKGIIERVFEHWKVVMNHTNAKASPERLSKIKARIKDGYTEADCMDAIEGCAKSDYHMGRDLRANPAGTVYDSIGLIFRTGEKLEGFIRRNNQKKANNIKEKTEQDKFNYGEIVGDMK